jgi:Aldo/keto reductase family
MDQSSATSCVLHTRWPAKITLHAEQNTWLTLSMSMLTESIRCENIPMPISRIGLGTWAIGGWMWGGTNDDDAVRTIRHALDQGINLVDTAPVYGFGHSEEIVGKALAEGGRRDRAGSSQITITLLLIRSWPRRSKTRLARISWPRPSNGGLDQSKTKTRSRDASHSSYRSHKSHWSYSPYPTYNDA